MKSDSDFRNWEPPNDLDAERCVLASLMLCPEGEQQIFEITKADLKPESFFQPDHGIIFGTISRMHREGKKIDAILLRGEMMRAGLYAEVGGDGALAKILNSVPTFVHGPRYAALVVEKYAMREIIRVANSAIRRVAAPALDDRAREIARMFANELAEITATGDADHIVKLSDAVDEVMQAQKKKEVRRCPTGLLELDDIIGGIAKGKFTQVGGRPGMGKSMICKQIVLTAAQNGTACGIVSIEEDREKIAQNYLSNLSRIENNKIIYNNLSEEDVAELIKAVPEIQNLPIYLSDSPTKISEVESAITSLVMRYRCELVVVDYLQLISPDEGNDNENREITKISKSLKNIFKRLDIAGLVPVQLNRGNETGGVRRPTMRDLRGSGSLEQDGDCIILLHREDYYHRGEDGYAPNNQIEVIIAKNKDGCVGTVPLFFDATTQRVTNWQGQSKEREDSTEGMFA